LTVSELVCQRDVCEATLTYKYSSLLFVYVYVLTVLRKVIFYEVRVFFNPFCKLYVTVTL